MSRAISSEQITLCDGCDLTPGMNLLYINGIFDYFIHLTERNTGRTQKIKIDQRDIGLYNVCFCNAERLGFQAKLTGPEEGLTMMIRHELCCGTDVALLVHFSAEHYFSEESVPYDPDELELNLEMIDVEASRQNPARIKQQFRSNNGEEDVCTCGA